MRSVVRRMAMLAIVAALAPSSTWAQRSLGVATPPGITFHAPPPQVAPPLVVRWMFVPATPLPAPRPSLLGTRVFEEYPLEELVDRIDWTPFFQTWELPGHYPAILEDPLTRAAAAPLYEDARRMLDRIVCDRLLRARAVIGFWPAAAAGDDIELYTDERRSEVLRVVHTLRQLLNVKGD